MTNSASFIHDLIKASSGNGIDVPDEMVFRSMYVPMEGAPQKHPHEKTKVLFVKNPFEDAAMYWELPVSAIGRIEEVDSIVSEDGRTAMVLRLWIRKGTKAVACTPYVVT